MKKLNNTLLSQFNFEKKPQFDVVKGFFFRNEMGNRGKSRKEEEEGAFVLPILKFSAFHTCFSSKGSISRGGGQQREPVLCTAPLRTLYWPFNIYDYGNVCLLPLLPPPPPCWHINIFHFIFWWSSIDQEPIFQLHSPQFLSSRTINLFIELLLLLLYIIQS